MRGELCILRLREIARTHASTLSSIVNASGIHRVFRRNESERLDAEHEVNGVRCNGCGELAPVHLVQSQRSFVRVRTKSIEIARGNPLHRSLLWDVDR
jgi:hypothetical protein